MAYPGDMDNRHTAILAPTSKRAALQLQPGVLAVDGGRNRLEVDHGRLRVPENRGRVDSRWIELAFVRFPAQTPRPGPPIVFLAGGPGASGIRVAQRIPRLFIELSKVADVIALDQRGVGFSRPCLDTCERWDLPLSQPGDRQVFLDTAVQRARAVRRFCELRGVDLRGYNTVESADDIEDLRQALGVEQVSLYGLSYGSHLGLAVLRRHRQSVNRAVLGLIEGPDDTYKLPINTQRHLEHVAELARSSAVLGGRAPNLLEMMGDVLDSIESSPRVAVIPAGGQGSDRCEVVMGAFDFQEYIASALGSIRLIRSLPRVMLEFQAGDFSTLAVDTRERRQEFLPSAMSLAMDAASGVTPARQELIRSQSGSALLGDVFNLPFPHVGAALGVEVLGADYRSPVISDVPTLFLSGTLDGRTPVTNAEAVLANFRHAQHLIVEGASHSYFPEVDETARRFLAGDDSTHAGHRVPFEFLPLAD